jgi:hypothetical protein
MYALKPVVVLPDELPHPGVMYDLPCVQRDGQDRGRDIDDGFSRQVSAA